MIPARQTEITQLLHDWRAGKKEAFDRLLPIVYGELRRMARGHMRRENAGHVLQTSALVNEAYLRLVHHPEVEWKDRAHFFGVASVVMRRILVDYARREGRAKRGGAAVRVELADDAVAAWDATEEILSVDEALKRLTAFDERKARVVEMRFFGGMDVAATAAVLGISENTVIRDWSTALAWLRSSLASSVKSE